MAKTQYSLSTDPGLVGRPKKFDVPLRDVMVSAGAGFVVVLTGDIMTMPGLPKVPAAESIDIDADGQIVGLLAEGVRLPATAAGQERTQPAGGRPKVKIAASFPLAVTTLRSLQVGGESAGRRRSAISRSQTV